ncbi:LOW QUALITY PROTEIN: hypothetical protein SETIT_5G050000v2 [Setaria italica]|uniref:Peptidase S1 domain-containing protein n=1 Tax=Setaria italica TaxID=4555 RepID=A0A368R1B6_SETIT|nr:LOW QUALITY PROTEIN: hypothetical protein SETIT_5G050000v2 [Setaria italica]
MAHHIKPIRSTQYRGKAVHRKNKKNKGRGTGFIVVNTANKLVVMTCGHPLNEWEWVRGTKVGVTFHDMGDASAEAVWVNTEKEVALLLIDTSSNPELSAYPAVDFSYDDVGVGDFLVTLGHPHDMRGYHEAYSACMLIFANVHYMDVYLQQGGRSYCHWFDQYCPNI